MYGLQQRMLQQHAAGEEVSFLLCISFLFIQPFYEPSLNGEEERDSLIILQSVSEGSDGRAAVTNRMDVQEEQAGRCLHSDPTATDMAEGRAEFRPAGRRMALFADCQT